MLRPHFATCTVPVCTYIYDQQCINIRWPRWQILPAHPLEGAAGRDSVRKPRPSQPAPSAERAFRLLDPWRERDACGVGFVARADGDRTNDILSMALTAVARLAHRGAASNDKSGDGAGVLTQIPHRLLGVGPVERVALGMFFLPQSAGARDTAIDLIETVLVGLGMSVLGWRVVPVDATVLGPLAAASQPAIRQVFVGPPSGPMNAQVWERRLYLARRVIERRAASAVLPVFVCSLSCRTVVYKALLVGTELPGFYADLRSPLFETGIAVFHQRYSTNTLPSWPLAQPFRFLAHNGAINTLWGNRNAMLAREPALAAPVWERDVEQLKPVIWEDGSDSTSLDNALELLVRSGRDPVHALMMLLPEAWERIPDMHPALRSFYEYHAGLMEPWDGPAALAFSDGVVAGSALDRNGLRPCRYKVTRDNVVVAGSEVGIVDLDPGDVVESGRLGPGELLVVDTLRNVVLHSADAKLEVAQRCPYRRWTTRVVRELPAEVSALGPALPADELAARQRVAQVTNPAIDPLREELVMSLVMYLGRRGSLLAQRPGGRTLLRIEHPVLRAEEMAALRRAGGSEIATLSAVWEAAAGPDELARALETLSRDAVTAVRRGATLLVISDRDVDKSRAPIPMLLAVGAVHQRLVQARQRVRVGLVAEAGDAWDVHHFAALFGYGAEAVHPWLALQYVRDDASASRFREAAEKGLLKILSKMGISTLQSYTGAQIFEAIGLGREVMDRCFTGTASVSGGIGFREIAEDVLARQPASVTEALPDHGRVRYRRDGEDHGWSPPLVRALQHAEYAGFADGVRARAPAGPRDLLDFHEQTPVSLEDVEPAEDIRRRFISSAMSLGALSPEAHATLAIAMNRMHARSNSGEGGEDPATWVTPAEGIADRSDNRIKQVASGRFGVTTAYLVRADELEIKIAQGSKPGEGGQLPGHKVTDLIARLRHAVVGIPLISPPPHHDIYSIEDLAQLIHDLKQVNPDARVGVKLVAEAGV